MQGNQEVMKKKKYTEILSFKVTAEFICPNMIDQKTLDMVYDSDPMYAYSKISEMMTDSVTSFATSEKVIKVEIIKEP